MGFNGSDDPTDSVNSLKEDMRSGTMVQCTIHYGRPKAVYCIGYAVCIMMSDNVLFGELYGTLRLLKVPELFRTL